MKWLKEHRFAWIIAILVVLMTTGVGISAGGRNQSTLPEGIVSGGFGSVSRIFYAASHYADNFFSYVSGLGTLSQRNQELEALVNDYKNRLTDYDRMANENATLKNLLVFKEQNAQYQYLTATVTAIDPDVGFNLFVLDRGSQDGVEKNMSVILKEGLVGRVVEVSTFTSKILAVSDNNSMVNGVNVRTGSYVRVTGTEDYQLKGFMDMEADVAPGDIIVTSGFSGIFKPDLVIGEVKEVTTPQGMLEKEIFIAPAVEMDRIKYVLIIK